LRRFKVDSMPILLKSKMIVVLLGPTIIGFCLVAGIVGLSLNATEFKIQKNHSLLEKIESCVVYSAVNKIKTDPVKIVDHVNAAYHGDWNNYIKTWEIYRNNVQSIINSAGWSSSERQVFRLTDNSLLEHLIDIENRLTMIKCLKYINVNRIGITNPNNY